LIIVGTATSYSFSETGITLTSPIPNVSGPIGNDYNTDVAVADIYQYFDFGTYGELTGEPPGLSS
jgi:hypothetical protein